MARFFLSALSFGQGVPHCQPALQGADGEFPGNQDLLQLRVQRVPLLGLGPAGVGGLGAVACGRRAAAEEGGHGPGQEVAFGRKGLRLKGRISQQEREESSAQLSDCLTALARTRQQKETLTEVVVPSPQKQGSLSDL